MVKDEAEIGTVSELKSHVMQAELRSDQAKQCGTKNSKRGKMQVPIYWRDELDVDVDIGAETWLPIIMTRN